MSIGQLVEQSTGQIYPLGYELVTIGRHEDNTVILPDPLVSRHHTEIAMQGGEWVIRDLGSANGTYVNGQRITGPRVLDHGDSIQVGHTRFQTQIAEALARQDTLVERLRPEDVLEARSRRPWLPVALGLAAVVVVVAILVGTLAILSGTGDDEGEGGTQVSQATASATATEPPLPTDTLRPAKPTGTAIPTIPPPSPQPTLAQPTAGPPPTDPPAAQPVIGFFRADQSTMETGQCTRLQWGQVENASSITLSGVGPVSSAGRLDVCLDSSKSYTLQATGPGGTAEESVQITVQPPSRSIIEYFRVVPSIIAPGDCALLEWGKVDNATSAVIEPGIGGVGTPGNQEVCPDSTTTYVLTARNPKGSSTAWITLIVSAESVPNPVIAFFTASPGNIQAGQCTTLSWGKVDYATSVTIDLGIGGVGTPGSKEVCPGTTTTYAMTAVGPSGTTESSLEVTVSAGQLADLPDLVVESILFVPNPCFRGQKCKIQVKVRNDGPVGAEHFVVRWAPAGAEAVPVEWDMDLLGAGQEKELRYTWIPGRPDESWRTSAAVDVYDEVEEIEEGEANDLDQAITVLEP
jgi:pSer/pThr/pTyr-binding forkhead associated (FHA) protein